MRKLAVALLLTATAGVASATASPITVQHLQDWNNQEFSDSAPPQWTHTITFVPPAASIVDAELEIRHKGNVGSSFFGEVWFLSTQGSVHLGNLENSDFFGGFWKTDSFSLPVSLLPSLPTGSWNLALKLGENTGGSDKITLDYAKLTVAYEPVTATQTPEPATLTLLGTGFATAMWRRRRQQRRSAV
jgi:hypothetical protein